MEARGTPPVAVTQTLSALPAALVFPVGMKEELSMSAFACSLVGALLSTPRIYRRPTSLPH
jgi:hypothetical protein